MASLSALSVRKGGHGKFVVSAQLASGREKPCRAKPPILLLNSILILFKLESEMAIRRRWPFVGRPTHPTPSTPPDRNHATKTKYKNGRNEF